MSRLNDLIGLIQTTNEVYFITAPGRVRTVFILVDDIVELALKLYLQERARQERLDCQEALATAGLVTTDAHSAHLRSYFAGHKNVAELAQSLGRAGASAITDLQDRLAAFTLLQHWSLNNSEAHKTFDKVVEEVKALRPDTQYLLRDIYERHRLRNEFYHDPTKMPYTVDNDKCLKALCDLFLLMEMLYPDFPSSLNSNKTVRCQIGVIRLKFEALQSGEVKEPYARALQILQRDFRPEDSTYEHTILHTISGRFYLALCDSFRDNIAKLQTRVDKITSMRNPDAEQTGERDDKLRKIKILSDQLETLSRL